ncbi:MAG: DNA alkylation repair protein [Duncaniella sp.]|nr:DNA alkylation repair protein [Duncaniella sp.]
MTDPTFTVSADDIIATLVSMKDDKQREILSRFFKTGKGQYGEGDRFLGLKVPQTREVVKAARRQVSLEEIARLLQSEWHEVRLCGFLLLVEEMKSALPRRREAPTVRADRRRELADFYLAHARQANNWDLVDLSCEKILGSWLLHPCADGSMPSRDILDRLAESPDLWEQRIAIVTTLELIRAREFDDTLRIARKLLSHPHDLIHKAVGWALRELGKRDIDLLRNFLDINYHSLPRTTLRYAIERMDPAERHSWLNR